MSGEVEALVAAARAAAANAYAPYSCFAVGAALRLTDGSVVTGANVENASYGLSLCAETVAVAKLANEGRLGDLVAVAIVGGGLGADAADPVLPCGRCRQVLNEAAQRGGREVTIHCSGLTGGHIVDHLLSALLPHAFGPADLGLA